MMSAIAKCVSLSAASLSLLTLLAATANAEPRRPTHVACVGDSITQGSGASSPSKNYVSQLQVLLGDQVNVQNFGRSGATMLSAGFGDKPYTLDSKYTDATSFVSKAPEGAVVTVLIILGANDSKPINWDPANKPKNDQQFLKDYRAMVDHFSELPLQAGGVCRVPARHRQ
jgi:lysophospholipase L1-like esterase